MRNEHDMENTNSHEAAEVHAPAASASGIINRKNHMSNMWPFVGGVLVGAAGVVAVALVVDTLDSGSSGKDEKNGQKEPLALPAGKGG